MTTQNFYSFDEISEKIQSSIDMYSATDNFSLNKEKLLESMQKFQLQTQYLPNVNPLNEDERIALTQIFDTLKYPDVDDINYVSKEIVKIIDENLPKLKFSI
jgi:hypothetical protein